NESINECGERLVQELRNACADRGGVYDSTSGIYGSSRARQRLATAALLDRVARQQEAACRASFLRPWLAGSNKSNDVVNQCCCRWCRVSYLQQFCALPEPV
uniref:IlGF domain-containing protein n=1 Tax=Macrostomum lignano TaxID=282301 RepID=A0A1I8FJR3_9PLAT